MTTKRDYKSVTVKHPQENSSHTKPTFTETQHPAAEDISTEQVLQLQRTIGNRATQRVLSRREPSEPDQAAAKNPVQEIQPATVAPGRVIQRFGAAEHKRIGDGPFGSGDPQMVKLTEDYSITYGEMIAMAGDHFESIGQMRQFAANSGTGADSREEIEYVRVVEINGKKGEKGRFSDAAINSAKARYYKLAGGNDSHFLNPVAGDTARAPSDKADDVHQELRLQWQGFIPQVTSVTLPNNAGAGYRRNHVQALMEAYFAGLEGQGVDSALAAEAFGAHYLTDAFAGGHLRTPRTSISEHWNTRVPMFNFNLKGYISQRLAETLTSNFFLAIQHAPIDNFPDLPYGILTVEAIYGETVGKVTSILDSKGFIRFGDVVAGAIHDYDNQRGVIAEVDGVPHQLFGDGHLSESATQEDLIRSVVNVSHNDVTRVYEMGKAQTNPLAVIAAVYQDGLFAAERMLPKVVPDSNLGPDDQSVKWDYDDVEGLLGDSQFQEAFKLFAKEKAGEFAEAKEGLEEYAQQEALQLAVIDPLGDPSQCLGVLRDVINWTPDTGGGLFGHNQDDNALEYYEEAKSKGQLDKLTLKQKKDIIGNLLDGATIGDEEDAIMDLLKAKPADAKALINEFGWERLHDDIDDLIGNEFEDTFPEDEYG